jgi:phosphate transport system permease protein
VAAGPPGADAGEHTRIDPASAVARERSDLGTQAVDVAVNLPGLMPMEDRPRRRAVFTPHDFVQAGLAALAAAAFAAMVRAIWGLSGPTGTFIWWYVAFLVVFFLLVRDNSDTENAVDRIVTVGIWSVGLLVVAVLGWMMTFLLIKGLPALRAGFFTSDLSKVGPLTPGGGAYHAIIGTIEQVGLAVMVVVPLAILTAVYLHEMKGVLAKPVRLIVDAMAGLPSIVAGLLVFTIWVDGRGFSGVAGSAALVVLMLPTVTRASEEILRTVPDSLREASLALGAPQWRVVLRVVLPTARAGLVTAVILGIARGVGETAPMLLTAFGADTTNTNPLKGPQEDLPLFVWKLIRLPNQNQVNRGWTGMLILVLLVLLLFTTARFVASRADRKLGRSR